jgi:hypothetical protein
MKLSTPAPLFTLQRGRIMAGSEEGEGLEFHIWGRRDKRDGGTGDRIEGQRRS